MFVTDAVLEWCYEYNLPHNADGTNWREIKNRKFHGTDISYQLFNILRDAY